MSPKSAKGGLAEKVQQALRKRELGRKYYKQADQLVHEIAQEVEPGEITELADGRRSGAHRQAGRRKGERVLPGGLATLRDLGLADAMPRQLELWADFRRQRWAARPDFAACRICGFGPVVLVLGARRCTRNTPRRWSRWTTQTCWS